MIEERITESESEVAIDLQLMSAGWQLDPAILIEMSTSNKQEQKNKTGS